MVGDLCERTNTGMAEEELHLVVASHDNKVINGPDFSDTLRYSGRHGRF